ncbi:MAG: hypothetical protein ACOC1F_03860 [Myxococcota bacterium]
MLYHYEGNAAEQDKIRSKLLGPYERVAELERAEVRKRRAKRKTDREED